MAANLLTKLISQASPRFVKGQKEEEERSIEPISYSFNWTGRSSYGKS